MRKNKKNRGDFMSKMKDDAVLTTDEAIQYLRVSKPTLFKHIRHGKIKAVKVGREWKVSPIRIISVFKKRANERVAYSKPWKDHCARYFLYEDVGKISRAPLISLRG